MSTPATPLDGPEFEALLDSAQSGDAEARYRLGLHYVEKSDFGRARRWFSRSGADGHGLALLELGRIKLRGLGIAASLGDAIVDFHQALEHGAIEAHCELAPLYFRGRGVDVDRKLAAHHMVQAARAGHPASLRICAFLFAEASDQTQATRCLQRAARGNDVIAQNALAQRLATGIGTPVQANGARYWAQQARANGSYCQQNLHQLAEGDEIESEPDGPLSQAEEIPELSFADIPMLPNDRPIGHKPLHLYPAAFSHEECEYLIESAAPFLLPSFTVNPQTGEPLLTQHRTSDAWSFHPTQEDIVILRLKERLTRQTGLPVEYAESFSMLRYRKGQQYRPHFDWINPESGEANYEIGRYGQRQTTIFSYLTNVEAGGETEFPRLELKVPPREGRAVQFSNILEDGRPDPESLHASLPVEKGEKWLATLWIRQRPMDL